MQTDPIGYGDGMNWYNYTHSEPINHIDPSGRDLDMSEWSCYGNCGPGYANTADPNAPSGFSRDNAGKDQLTNQEAWDWFQGHNTYTEVDPNGHEHLETFPRGGFIVSGPGGIVRSTGFSGGLGAIGGSGGGSSSPKPSLASRFFLCGEVGVVFGGGVCGTGNGHVVTYVAGGAIDGPSAMAGYAPNGATNFLTGPSVVGAAYLGMGVTPSGDVAYVASTGIGGSVSYGTDVGGLISDTFYNFSKGAYDALGRPYEQKTGY